MKKLFIAPVLAYTLVSCSHVTSTAPPTITQVAVDCGLPAVRDLATHLLDDVLSGLVAANWEASLAAVAMRAGADGLAAVKCAVAEIFLKTDIQMTARAEMPDEAYARTQLLHERAFAYLAAH